MALRRAPVAELKPVRRPTKKRSDARVGHVLREAREQRGLSLDDASRALRVSVRHLHALEEGDLSVFRADVYAQGAFTMYTQYLGVHAERHQRSFRQILAGASEAVPLKVHTPRSWLAATITPRWILAGVILSVALLVGVYVAWQVTSFFRLPALTVFEPTAVVTDPLVTVRGEAALDADIFVNGEQVLMNEAGEFTSTLRLHDGINPLRVEATNAAGRTRTLERDILLSQP